MTYIPTHIQEASLSLNFYIYSVLHIYKDHKTFSLNSLPLTINTPLLHPRSETLGGRGEGVIKIFAHHSPVSNQIMKFFHIITNMTTH